MALNLALAVPALALRPYVLGYFLVSHDQVSIIDNQRADVGGLTFVLNGSGRYVFDGDHEVQIAPVTLNGPTTSNVQIQAVGPLRFVVISLQPDFWGGLAHCPADMVADSGCEAHLCLKVDPAATHARLVQCKTVEEMAPIIDAYLMPMINPLSPDHRTAIETIRAWIAASLFPHVPDLYDQFTLSARQVIRIANRYFGSPPKVLARKYGALRTASAILAEDEAVLDIARSHYADHSHMIREIRRFTGVTPRQLLTGVNPLMRITLLGSNFRELAPLA